MNPITQDTERTLKHAREAGHPSVCNVVFSISISSWSFLFVYNPTRTLSTHQLPTCIISMGPCRATVKFVKGSIQEMKRTVSNHVTFIRTPNYVTQNVLTNLLDGKCLLTERRGTWPGDVKMVTLLFIQMTCNVAPPGQSGLFSQVSRVDIHTYIRKDG